MSTYSADILATTGLVSYWRLGEPSGTTAADSQGTNTLTWTGSPPLGVTGLLVGDTDTATALNGSSQYGQLDPSSGMPSAAPFTVEAWVKPTNASVTMRWMDYVNSGGNAGWLVGQSSGKLRFTTSAIQDYDTVGTYLTAGATHHVVVVFTTAFSALFYVDGLLQETITGPSNPTAVANGVITVGKNNHFAGSEFYDGTIDEVAVYNVALSAATILDHYTVGTTASQQFIHPFNAIPFMTGH